MKRCPKCNRTYTNDAQKFCTHDGGLLLTDAEPERQAFDPNATILTDAPTLITDAPGQPSSTPLPTMPVRPPAQDLDLNKTIAGGPPPPQTADFRRGDTGPASRPTSSNLPPAQGSASLGPSSQQQQSQPISQPAPQSTSQPAPYTSQPFSQQTPAPQQQQAMPAISGPAAQAAHTAQPARRKSKLPWILGGVAVLGVLFVALAAALYFVVRPRLFANANANVNTSGNRNTSANANANTNTNGSAAPNANAVPNASSTPDANINANIASTGNGNNPSFVPPPNSVQFVNSSANLDGKLAEHYLDFSFYYPRSWKSDPKSGVAGASNFVKVERLLPPDYTQEQFAVAWYESGGTIESDRDKFAKLVETLNNNYRQFPEYRKVSEEDTKINSYDGHEFRFESISRNTAKGDIKLWGRIVFLPPGVEGQKNGLILLMLATSLAPELSGVEDVGAKGEMPLILESFRLGKTQ